MHWFLDLLWKWFKSRWRDLYHHPVPTESYSHLFLVSGLCGDNSLAFESDGFGSILGTTMSHIAPQIQHILLTLRAQRDISLTYISCYISLQQAELLDTVDSTHGRWISSRPHLPATVNLASYPKALKFEAVHAGRPIARLSKLDGLYTGLTF